MSFNPAVPVETGSAPRDVIIFGTGEIASMAWYVLTHDSPYRVVAFTVDAAYRTSESLHGLPVAPFEQLPERYPPMHYALHLPIGWKRMNALRAEKLAQARSMGYTIVSYVSSRAQVWPDLRMGENCAVHQAVSIGPFVELGQNCLVFASANLGHHIVVGDDCYIAGRASISGGALIGERCVLGANCTVLDGVKVAPGCFIGAGALLTRDTEANGVYTGAPAKRRIIAADRLPIVL